MAFLDQAFTQVGAEEPSPPPVTSIRAGLVTEIPFQLVCGSFEVPFAGERRFLLRPAAGDAGLASECAFAKV